MQRRLTKKLTTLLILLLLSALGIGISQTGELTAPKLDQPIQPGYHRVVSVSDGDTFQVEIAGKRETIRMIGIDTPETRDPRKPVQCFGKAASARLTVLLQDKTVRLEGDPASGHRDKYQRLLRWVYLEDGSFVNQLMVQEGYAFAYTIFPNGKLEQLRSWEREARDAKRGLWAGCQVQEADDKRETTSE